ncbi:hypothetical protein KQ717_15415, partial [Listeria monocytogenes]|nr:hypothetical protein [Listeria monocytogenes]
APPPSPPRRIGCLVVSGRAMPAPARPYAGRVRPGVEPGRCVGRGPVAIPCGALVVVPGYQSAGAIRPGVPPGRPARCHGGRSIAPASVRAVPQP